MLSGSNMVKAAPQHTGKRNQQDLMQAELFLKGTPTPAISFFKYSESDHSD